jgi:hypothetical protein
MAVAMGASLLLEDDSVVPIRIENLSPHGVMGKCDAELPAGAWLGIDLPGFGIVRACVRWSEHGEIGCHFRKAIDPERLEAARGPIRSPFAAA